MELVNLNILSCTFIDQPGYAMFNKEDLELQSPIHLSNPFWNLLSKTILNNEIKSYVEQNPPNTKMYAWIILFQLKILKLTSKFYID